MFQNVPSSPRHSENAHGETVEAITSRWKCIREAVFPATGTLCAAILLAFPALLFAQEEKPRPPHYTETTIHNVDGSGGNVVAREYIDGMGRNVQSQRKINRTDQGFSSIVSGREYDELNRPHKMVKPFGYINPENPLEYIPQKLSSDPHCANNYYNGTSGRADAAGYPFVEFKYNDDPRGGRKIVGAPGIAYSAHSDPTIGHPLKTWYFGVPGDATRINGLTLFDEDGFILANYLSVGGAGSDEFLDDVLSGELSETDEELNYYLTVSKDRNGNYSQNLIDKFGRVLRTWRSHKEDSEPIVDRYAYDVLGRTEVETPPATPGKTSVAPSEYDYSPRSQLKTRITPDAGTITYSYDDAGRLQEVVDQMLQESRFDIPTSGEDETIQPRLRYEYDDLGRLVTVSRYEPSLEEPQQTKWCTWIRNIYDDPEEARQFLSNSAFPEEEAELDALLTTCTNMRGRLVASIAYNADFYKYRTGDDKIASVESMYDKKVIDLYSYDDEGRINRAYKSIPDIELQLKKWGYDLHGRVVADTIEFGDPLTRIVTRYTYDVDGRLSSVYRDDKLYATNTYDDLGRLQKREFMPGTEDARSIEYAYTINEWTKKIEASNSAFSEELCYEINDIADALLEGKSFTPRYDGGISRAKAVTGASGLGSDLDLLYQYDKAGRLVEVDNNKDYTDSDKFDASFEYQNDGRFTEKHEGPDEADWEEYTYHAKDETHATNKVKSIPGSGKGDATVANFIYDPNGNMILDRAKRMAVEYDWSDMPVNFYMFADPIDGEIDTWEEVKSLYDGEWIRKVTMTYDASGNRVKKETFEPAPEIVEPEALLISNVSDGTMLELLPDGTINTNRLITGFTQETPEGALLSENGGEDRLALSGLALQLSGTLVGESGRPVEDGDLAAAELGAATPQMAVSAAGEGVVLSGSLAPPAFISGVAYVDESHVFVRGGAKDDYELSYVNFADGVSHPDNSFEFHVKDHLGSVRVVLTEDGTVKEASAYLAYGKEKEITSAPEPARQKYAGKEFDEDGVAYDGETKLTNGIGLNYFGARYYDPEVGTWTSTDPADEFWNSYSYVGGDPVNFSDPSGMFSVPARPMSMFLDSKSDDDEHDYYEGMNHVPSRLVAGPIYGDDEDDDSNSDRREWEEGPNKEFHMRENSDGFVEASRNKPPKEDFSRGRGRDLSWNWGGRDIQDHHITYKNHTVDLAKRNALFFSKKQPTNLQNDNRIKTSKASVGVIVIGTTGSIIIERFIPVYGQIKLVMEVERLLKPILAEAVVITPMMMDGIIEDFPTPEDACGLTNENLTKRGEDNANNSFMKKNGFTKKRYFKDSRGNNWSTHYNPKTGRYTGGHRSSGQ